VSKASKAPKASKEAAKGTKEAKGEALVASSTQGQGRFDFDVDPLEARDAEARRLAIDPRRNVALEASAGTGKTRVLVDRYVALLSCGVSPRHILAITFTRKAAAEMRQRILQELAKRERDQTIAKEIILEVRESLGDIAISTIDAFCLALLREFPLEADVDPAFDLADETETPRLVEEALEQTMRAGRGIAAEQPEMAMLFGELGEFQLRQGLARLLDRRLVAWDALNRFVRGAEHATIDQALSDLFSRLRAAFASVPGGVEALLSTGPAHADFVLFARDLRQLLADPAPEPATTQALLERVREHLLTQSGEPRKRFTAYKKSDFRSSQDYDRHLGMVQALGPHLSDALKKFRTGLNLVLARAVRQLFAIAVKEYQRTLRKHAVLDFADVLQRTLALLSQMDEFSRSRFKLEARYQHVLVDEFQDTSRAQWELVELLVRSWAAGNSMADRDPTIFIVGDRKQSIYGFRDAEVAVLDEAAHYIEALRHMGQVRTAITRSFRSVRPLLHFVNDLCTAIDKAPERVDAFRYSQDDEFPLGPAETADEALGLVGALSDAAQADAVAEEITRLLTTPATVRDRDTGLRRAVRAGDIAILFRTREGHQAFEEALARRCVPYYVYKGLGFFDADEIKDVLALLAFLARPQSELYAAAFLRSRFIRLSDDALKQLAPDLSRALTAEAPPVGMATLHEDDRRRLALARDTVPVWLSLVDRIPPAELLDRVLADSAYAAEIRGASYRQARENLKKVRGIVRRMQNRGYATVSRVIDHLAHLVAGGDESNAIVDAVDAVNLMTTHAAKGLEFPIVFLVHLQRGSGGTPDPIRVWPSPAGDESIEPFVSIGTNESEGDRDHDAREAEEGKRLLYVAVTRARDRLYLAATLNEGARFAPGKGGLGRTLPANVGQLFDLAASSASEVTWAGASGVHRFRVLAPAPETPTTLAAASEMARDEDFAPLVDTGPRRTTVTQFADFDSDAFPSSATGASSSADLGLLVHRALQAQADVPESLSALACAAPDGDDLVAAARQALASIRTHPEVVRLMDDDVVWRHYEVPFTWRRDDGTFVRGAIDCVVQRRDGSIHVFEFKTGQRDAAHDTQLDLYVAAARCLFSGAPVEGHLIYAGEREATFREYERLT
jgi:ATP-dependent helicase/nuclease subunit A